MKQLQMFGQRTGLSRDALWDLLAAGSVVAAGFAARSILDKGWELITGEEPPLDPADIDTDWREAVVWTVCVGAVMGLSRLAARRGTHRFNSRRSSLPSRRLRARLR